MSVNIITIDINSEREGNPIIINKPLLDEAESQALRESQGDMDHMVKEDIKDITLTSLYMASMLTEEDEVIMLEIMLSIIKKRQDEITEDN